MSEIAVPSDEQIIAAYFKTRSIWKAGDDLGIRGQKVAARLKASGIPTFKRWFSDEENAKIIAYYKSTPAETFDLDFLCKLLGRAKTTLCKQAGILGLTDTSRPPNSRDCKKISERAKERLATQGHPRGMLGKKHTSETLKAVGDASRRNWLIWKTFNTGPMAEEHREKMALLHSKRMQGTPAHKSYSRAVKGYRDDIPGFFFRSTWEANYARYLNLLVKLGVVVKWEYEPETYWFEGIKRGVLSYKPDFRVWYKGDPLPVTVEIKGWVTPKDRTKWKRMAKYHPDVKLEIVREKQYRAIKNKWASSIPNWEDGRPGNVIASTRGE